MEEKIKAVYADTEFLRYGNRNLYVADFSERTSSEKGVEVIPDTKPANPEDSGQEMECFHIHNPGQISLLFAFAQLYSRHKYFQGVHELAALGSPPRQNKQACSALGLIERFDLFGKHRFVSAERKDLEHCECCFFPETPAARWVCFLEIKDCKPKNIPGYRSKAKQQVRSTVEAFRSSGILDKEKVYGVISFPRKKTAFNDLLFADPIEYKKWARDYRIHFFAANKVQVEQDSLKIVRL